MTNLLAALKGFMSYSNARHLVLTDNIARANIPGQKAYDITSQTNLSFNGALSMAVTSNGHISGKNSKKDGFKIERVKDTQETSLNGNNINIEEQTLKIADNANKYTVATEVYKKTLELLTIPLNDN